MHVRKVARKAPPEVLRTALARMTTARVVAEEAHPDVEAYLSNAVVLEALHRYSHMVIHRPQARR